MAVAGGCSSGKDQRQSWCANSSEIRGAYEDILKAEDVPFQSEGNCITYETRYALAFEAALAKHEPPAFRSKSFSDPQQQSSFERTLSEAGIATTRYPFMGQTYVAWNFEDSERVFQLWPFFPEEIEMMREGRKELTQTNPDNE